MEETEVLRRKLMENVADLREVRLQEVLDFIDFLQTRERGDEDSILERMFPCPKSRKPFLIRICVFLELYCAH